MRVDYHLHTEFSYDSKASIAAILERAQQLEMTHLCVTDHDTVEGALRLKAIQPPGIQIVVGCEFTAEDGSHVIGLDLKDMIGEKAIFALLEKLKLQGALVLLPHPFRRRSGVFRNERKRSEAFVRQVLSYADMVECFNGGDSYENNQNSYRFALTHGLPAVAGSDAHTPAAIGSVFVEYDADQVKHGVSPRRVFFPTQVPKMEHPVKKKVMECYHRNRESFPPLVETIYRTLREQLHRGGFGSREALPRLQYDFPSGRS